MASTVVKFAHQPREREVAMGAGPANFVYEHCTRVVELHVISTVVQEAIRFPHDHH